MNISACVASCMRVLCIAFVVLYFAMTESSAFDGSSVKPSIASKTAKMKEFQGYFHFWWDENTGKIWLEIDKFDVEFLYVNSLSTGLGSNAVGLDRGQLGRSRVVRFRRIGPKVFLEHQNLRYRANTRRTVERRAVQESFAQSILWGTEVAAESDGRVLVDATKFLMRDAHGVAGRLQQRGQNTFRLDDSRSAIFLPRTKSFPKNSEFEAILTFVSSNPGPLVRETAATPEAVTLRMHHSFIELPDGNYRPRRFDPRAPSFSISFADFAAPIDRPLEKKWIVRHRLQKRDPRLKSSAPVEPIVYYVDPAAPLKVRLALVEGARWWNQAFEAAGFKNAFRVEILPEHADPLDVRYNVIMWVHRSTRGWSYGNTVTDPRTGEIIKGHVTLGSLRVRQDVLLIDGLVPTANGNTGIPGQACDCCRPSVAANANVLANLDPRSNSVDVALARIRQLSAHEVGHTLGFAHNFAASTYDRASVMDYPAPLVRITDDDELDMSAAYDVGIGEWDIFGVKYAYTEFPADVDERRELAKLIKHSISAGQLFLSDRDARPAGAAHPMANLWDNGSDPATSLLHALRVRKIALAKFGVHNIPAGKPLAHLEAALLPVYLHHRYQIDATAKLLGGNYYSYAINGDGQRPMEWVAVDKQRKALNALLKCIKPQQLIIPNRILELLPPQPFGTRERELFPKRTAMLFDPAAAAEVAAKLVVSNLLQRQRAARLMMSQSIRAGFDFNQILDRLLEETWYSDALNDPMRASIQRVVQRVVLDEMISLASNPAAASDVRAVTNQALRQLHGRLKRNAPETKHRLARAHQQLAINDMQRFFDRPIQTAEPRRPLDSPPGSPIGK